MSDGYKEGMYWATIVDQGMAKSSNDNPMPWVEIQPIFWEPMDGKNREPVTVNWTRTIHLAMTRKNAHIVAEQLAALGFRGDPMAIADKEGEGRLIDKEGRFLMRFEEWEGKTQERWKIVTPRKQAERKQLDTLTQTEGLQVDAQFAAVFREAQGGQTPAPAPEAVQSTTTEDDPF